MTKEQNMSDEQTYYVLRTDKLSAPHYFGGAVELGIKPGIVITDLIFNAYQFASRADAEEAKADCGLPDFEISECSAGMSPALARAMKKARKATPYPQ